MPRRSRYAYRYDEFQQDREPIPVTQAGIIGPDSHLLNIANGQCGKVTVSCWPTLGGVVGGRTWGKLGSMNVAIIPFRTRAETTAPTAELETFDLELFLCEPDEQGFGPESFPEMCHKQQRCSHTAISLVNLPAPAHMAQCLIETSPDNGDKDKVWKFRSQEIQSCDGLARAARWTWDANGHEPVVLHGGVAFRHVERLIIVACRVRGKAFSKLSSQRIRLRYQFSSEESRPK